MDKAEKLSLTLSGVLLAVFFIVLIYASAAKGLKVPTCITDVEPFKTYELIKLDDKHYELHMVAQMWTFLPNKLELPVGSTVDIYLTSKDVIHGFDIEDKNVNLMAVPGTVNYTQVTFEEPGSYKFLCHEYCGIAHHNMAGEIIIK